jgi:lipoprotein-anchoring transpeptidase ErfK/SrfK
MASPPRNARQHRRAKREGRRKAIIGGVAAVVLVIALVGGYIAFAGGDDDPQVTDVRAGDRTPSTVEGPQISTPPPGHSYIATVKDDLTEIQVFEDQDAPLPAHTYPNPWLLNDDPASPIKQTFLAERVSKDGKWLHVFLPERPNGLTGWVRTDDVVVTENPYSIGVDLAKREITVREGTKELYQGPVAIGSDETPLPDANGELTPTPRGIYYIRVLLKTDDPSSVYGPYAYGLSAHSETLEEFNGGDAEVGIHGNNDESVLGKAVTHGCVRMDNEEIEKLTKILPLGTPVVIS